MERPFKQSKFVTFDLLLVLVLLIVGGAVLIPWGFADRDDPEDKIEIYHPKRILVEFQTERKPEDIIKAWGGSIETAWPDIDLYLVRMPVGIATSQALESLLAMGGIREVEPDFLGASAPTPSPARTGGRWGLEKIRAAEAWEVTRGTSDVVIAVMDTGLDTQHPKIINRVLEGFSPLVDEEEVPIPYHDDHGRGTHIAAISAAGDIERMRGVAPEASLVGIKTHDGEARHYRADLIGGLVWLGKWAKANPDKRVIALMDGGWRFQSPFLERAVKFAQDAGILLIAGSGDMGSEEKFFPAAYPGVLTVAAINPQDRLTDFSNFGQWVDIAAPGEDIFSAVTGGGYGYWDGTAVAAAYAAGVAALLWSEKPDLSPQEISDIIKTTSRSAAGLEDKISAGILDAQRAMEKLKEN